MVCLQHLGGQTGLNLAFQLDEKGILDEIWGEVTRNSN